MLIVPPYLLILMRSKQATRANQRVSSRNSQAGTSSKIFTTQPRGCHLSLSLRRNTSAPTKWRMPPTRKTGKKKKKKTKRKPPNQGQNLRTPQPPDHVDTLAVSFPRSLVGDKAAMLPTGRRRKNRRKTSTVVEIYVQDSIRTTPRPTRTAGTKRSDASLLLRHIPGHTPKGMPQNRKGEGHDVEMMGLKIRRIISRGARWSVQVYTYLAGYSSSELSSSSVS